MQGLPRLGAGLEPLDLPFHLGRLEIGTLLATTAMVVAAPLLTLLGGQAGDRFCVLRERRATHRKDDGAIARGKLFRDGSAHTSAASDHQHDTVRTQLGLGRPGSINRRFDQPHHEALTLPIADLEGLGTAVHFVEDPLSGFVGTFRYFGRLPGRAL